MISRRGEITKFPFTTNTPGSQNRGGVISELASVGCSATRDVEYRPRREAAAVRGEKGDHGGDLVRPTEAIHRNEGAQGIELVRARRVGEPALDDRWRDAVDEHPRAGEL